PADLGLERVHDPPDDVVARVHLALLDLNDGGLRHSRELAEGRLRQAEHLPHARDLVDVREHHRAGRRAVSYSLWNFQARQILITRWRWRPGGPARAWALPRGLSSAGRRKEYIRRPVLRGPHRRVSVSRSIFVEELVHTPIEEQTAEIVERKGVGHPDSVADGLAEAVSRALSKMYIERYGRILHHNTDQVEVVGGQSAPKFGGGVFLEPAYILLCG